MLTATILLVLVEELIDVVVGGQWVPVAAEALRLTNGGELLAAALLLVPEGRLLRRVFPVVVELLLVLGVPYVYPLHVNVVVFAIFISGGDGRRRACGDRGRAAPILLIKVAEELFA